MNCNLPLVNGVKNFVKIILASSYDPSCAVSLATFYRIGLAAMRTSSRPKMRAWAVCSNYKGSPAIRIITSIRPRCV